MLDYKCPASPSAGFNVCGLIERHEPQSELQKETSGYFSRWWLMVGVVLGGAIKKNKWHFNLLLKVSSRSLGSFCQVITCVNKCIYSCFFICFLQNKSNISKSMTRYNFDLQKFPLNAVKYMNRNSQKILSCKILENC